MIEVRLGPFELLLWPVTLPVRSFTFVLEQVRDAVDRELYDPDTLRRKLLELQMLYEAGELPEKVYRERWADLTGRLGTAAGVIGADDEP